MGPGQSRSELQEFAKSSGLQKSSFSMRLPKMCYFLPEIEDDQVRYLCSLPWGVIAQLEGKHKVASAKGSHLGVHRFSLMKSFS